MILLLGGTAEAADMARRLTECGHDVTTSLAGRTREPKPVCGHVRIGGFGGTEGLAKYLQEHAITLLIDMTHPFATRMSENARKASELANIRLFHWQRPGWAKVEGDNWIEVPDIPAAVAAVPASSRVLLALGSQHITPFATRADAHFLVRMVDAPLSPLALLDHELLIGKPGPVEEEFALLRGKEVTHIVCRNSGGRASYAKIAAARLLKLPVILIGRHDISAMGLGLTAFEKQMAALLAGKQIPQ